MGCAFSRARNVYEGEAPAFVEYEDRRRIAGFGFPNRKMDGGNCSGEIGLAATKAPETSSLVGRTGIIDVLDTLGSSLSNLNPNSGFVSGAAMRGNKVSILAFEIANTIAKGAKLMQSLVEENIQLLKKEMLISEGVQQLVFADYSELMRIAANDKREELHVFMVEVARFGDLCKDPEWHNLTRFLKLDSDSIPREKLKEEAEAAMQELISLAQLTSDLYHELHVLDRFEKDHKQRLHDKESFPTIPKREGLLLKQQRKLVKGLKKKSLWSRDLEEIVEKLVEVVIYLHKEISVAFGLKGPNHSGCAPAHNSQMLGASGLALHYANVINQIENIVSQPIPVPSTTRNTLYNGLPAGVKAALRSRIQSSSVNKLTVTQIKTEMQKTLQWISPMAGNTIKAYQAFGWVGEWANMGNEVNRKPRHRSSVARIHTLYYADREKTEEYILQLVVWLHFLVEQVKTTGFGVESCKPINYQEKEMSSSPEDSRDSCNYNSTVLRLTQEDRQMLESAACKKLVLRRSKSHGYVSKMKKTSKRRSRRCRSSNSSPTRDGANLEFRLERRKLLDVIDGLEMLDPFPMASFYK